MIGIISLAICACCQEDLSKYLDEQIERTQADIDRQYENHILLKKDPRHDFTIPMLCGIMAGFNTVKLHYEDPSTKEKDYEPRR